MPLESKQVSIVRFPVCHVLFLQRLVDFSTHGTSRLNCKNCSDLRECTETPRDPPQPYHVHLKFENPADYSFWQNNFKKKQGEMKLSELVTYSPPKDVGFGCHEPRWKQNVSSFLSWLHLVFFVLCSGKLMSWVGACYAGTRSGGLDIHEVYLSQKKKRFKSNHVYRKKDVKKL